METIAQTAIVLLAITPHVKAVSPALLRTILRALGRGLCNVKVTVVTPSGFAFIVSPRFPWGQRRASSEADAKQAKRIKARESKKSRKKKHKK